MRCPWILCTWLGTLLGTGVAAAAPTSPAAAGQGGAVLAVARGVEALGLNAAGVVLGAHELDAAVHWAETDADQRLWSLAGSWRRSGVGAGAFLTLRDPISPQRGADKGIEDWGVAAALLALQRPHGGHLSLGLELRRRSPDWYGDVGIQIEPIPLIQAAAVWHAWKPEGAWLSASLSCHWSGLLELVAERDVQSEGADLTRFGAALPIGENLVLRLGSLAHNLTWGVGLHVADWRLDLSTVADRRSSGLSWQVGLGLGLRPLAVEGGGP